VIERAFNCSRHAIHSSFEKRLNKPKWRRRHSAVSPESDANILAWITDKAEKNAAVARTDITNYCREVCKIEVTRRWVGSFISRDFAELTEKKTSRREAPRLQVPRMFLAQTVRSMHEAVQGRPADMVFNSILMKSGYPTGKTANRRRWWCREPPRSVRFIIDYLGV
jgi:hypothetical protein